MKKKIENAMLYVRMPDGSVWSVPVKEIAYNRAEYFAKEFGGDVIRSLKEDTIPLFEADVNEIKDWAEGNMDWSEVENVATIVSKANVDFDDGWLYGEKDIVYPK